MKTRFIEAHDATKFNHGKFMVARFEIDEWIEKSEVDYRDAKINHSLLGRCGWTTSHILVVDIQTGEGAIFKTGGHAKADLEKHKILVCPMFEPFLEWLYKQNLENLENLPRIVDLGNVPTDMSGYRRPGPKKEKVYEPPKVSGDWTEK